MTSICGSWNNQTVTIDFTAPWSQIWQIWRYGIHFLRHVTAVISVETRLPVPWNCKRDYS